MNFIIKCALALSFIMIAPQTVLAKKSNKTYSKKSKSYGKKTRLARRSTKSYRSGSRTYTKRSTKSYKKYPDMWLFRAGTITIAPQVDSGCLSAPDFGDGPDGCTKTDVNSITQPGGGVTWMATPNISVDVPLALPFTHQIKGDGSMSGSGTLGEIKLLPMTIFPQYRFFSSKSIFRPYVGLGLTYAYFFDPKGSAKLTATTNPGGAPTSFDVNSNFLLNPQIGATVNVYQRFFVDAFFTMAKFKTRTTLSTGQHVDVNLDPMTYGVSAGYRY